ncbi:MAG: hypothetical protein HHJ12_04815 [Glaciimonas sp.]|nr:hypothetical protein [Glaciimonas sp.]
MAAPQWRPLRAGYKKAVQKHDLTVLFSSFLMGEIAAATIFKQMFENSREAVFKQGFKNIGRDKVVLSKLFPDLSRYAIFAAGSPEFANTCLATVKQPVAADANHLLPL